MGHQLFRRRGTPDHGLHNQCCIYFMLLAIRDSYYFRVLDRMLQGSSDGEMEEEGSVLRAKVKRLAAILRASKYAVGFKWEVNCRCIQEPAFLQQQGFLIFEDLPESGPSKPRAKQWPSRTSPCLHLRSGVPSEKQTELHGNYCLETCPVCDARYYRSYAVWEGLTTPSTSIIPLSAHGNDHRTGRLCEADGCSGELQSSVVLFGEILPAKDVKSAWEHTSKADLALVLGSSLRVAPARAMPGQVAKNGGRLVIVNLQRTHFDGQASLVIYARCDEVMRLLVEELHLEEEQPSVSGENPSPLLEESASIDE